MLDNLLKKVEAEYYRCEDKICCLYHAEECTWELIAKAIKYGNIHLKIGDHVTTGLKDGRAMDFVLVDKPKGYYRFDSRDCFAQRDKFETSSENGYIGSGIRRYMDTELFDILPDDLKNIITPVIRKSLTHDENFFEDEFKIFLPDASELFVNRSNCNTCLYDDLEPYTQIEYYAFRKNRVKGRMKEADWDEKYRCFVESNRAHLMSRLGRCEACETSAESCVSYWTASPNYHAAGNVKVFYDREEPEMVCCLDTGYPSGSKGRFLYVPMCFCIKSYSD